MTPLESTSMFGRASGHSVVSECCIPLMVGVAAAAAASSRPSLPAGMDRSSVKTPVRASMRSPVAPDASIADWMDG